MGKMCFNEQRKTIVLCFSTAPLNSLTYKDTIFILINSIQAVITDVG